MAKSTHTKPGRPLNDSDVSAVNMFSTVHDIYVRVDSGVEKRALELKKVGLKSLDALHVACAEKARAGIFLTTDDNLLAKATKSEKTLKVKVENPLRWVMEALK
jgi:predicted nucleic acid-binding protein